MCLRTAAYSDCSFILFIIAKLMINVPQSAHVLKYSSIGGPLICGGRKTNKFRCERQSCYIYMNMQDHGWDIKMNLACMRF